jgi:hypothetical protein
LAYRLAPPQISCGGRQSPNKLWFAQAAEGHRCVAWPGDKPLLYRARFIQKVQVTPKVALVVADHEQRVPTAMAPASAFE